MKAPAGEFAGDVAEVASGEYLVAWRSDEKGRYSLQNWNATPADSRQSSSTTDANLSSRAGDIATCA